MTYNLTSMNKHLFYLSIALLAMLAIQTIFSQNTSNTDFNVLANWEHSPKSLEEADDLADQVIVGRVISVEKGKDLVTRAEEEPSGEMVIPTEIITIHVDNTLKGKNHSVVKLFRTGTSRYTQKLQKIPAKYAGKNSKQVSGMENSIQMNPFLLEGDPEFVIGDRHLLFLTDGPFGLKRTIAPEGRYRIDETDALVPVEHRGLSHKLSGVVLSDFHTRYENFKRNKKEKIELKRLNKELK